MDDDSAVRLGAFEFLRQQSRIHPNAMPWRLLSAGFDYRGRRVPLVSQQGIFKPALCRLPLSLRTAPPPAAGKAAPYEDEIGADGLLLYRYRGVDQTHYQNVGVREAMVTRTPLIYFFGVAEGQYVPAWPAFVEADDPDRLAFTISVGAQPTELASGDTSLASLEIESDGARRYATRTTLVRLHQQSFRRRVLGAYRDQCAICRLRHEELLDAAHILPDGHPDGKPIVPNGLALCTLHHAAFDRNVLGIRPDLRVEIRLDILDEVDGPMLQHGLKNFHEVALSIPRSEVHKPRREFLAERYELFRKAS